MKSRAPAVALWHFSRSLSLDFACWGSFLNSPAARRPAAVQPLRRTPAPALARDSHRPVSAGERERRGEGTRAAGWGTRRRPAQWPRAAQLLGRPGERSPALQEALAPAGTAFNFPPALPRHSRHSEPPRAGVLGAERQLVGAEDTLPAPRSPRLARARSAVLQQKEPDLLH